MRIILCFLFFCNVCFAEVLPEHAETRLKEGNLRFIAETSHHPNRCSERRLETADTQEPFATIVGCSDSRVAPEIIFDQGIGDLFIVRVAGNVVGPVEQDSIEYSVLILKSPLILVVGHQNCGAVNAVLSGQTKDIEAVAKLVQPAVDEAQKQKGDKLLNAIQNNARNVAKQLRKQKLFKKMIKEKKLGVKAAYYSFETGKVEILSD